MFTSIKNISHSLWVCLITYMVFTGSACTWKIVDQSASPKEDGKSKQTAFIERQQDRKSPKIKTFYHIDLGGYKESAGRRRNDAYAVSYIKTVPGKVQVGVVFPYHSAYYPEVEFTTAPGRKYLVTWICIPYPFVAIVDAVSSSIVALDSYCPDCEKFIGEKVLPSTECLNYMQPPWMKPDEDLVWSRWSLERINQSYRNLCYAAEHGVTSARTRLGDLYSLGIYRATKDPVRANFWYHSAPDDWEFGQWAIFAHPPIWSNLASRV